MPTPAQQKKLEKLAKVLDGGDVALLKELDTLEEKVDSLAAQIPDIDAVIERVKDGKDGEKGGEGDKGDQGEQGAEGIAGKDGLDGADGHNGLDGKDGRDGVDGLNGVDGRDGKDGADGFVDESVVAYLEDRIEKIEKTPFKQVGGLGLAAVQRIADDTVAAIPAHTGDVTGTTALTIDKTAITGKTLATAVGTDYVLISDTSDAGNLKKALVSDLGGGVSDGDKVDITVTASGATWTIDPGVVTLAKQADMATASVVYRKTAGLGAPEVQTLATLKTDLGLTGTNSGDQTITLTGGVTGSGTGSFAATVATNANLTGVVTSVGNATAIADTALSIAKTSGLQAALDAKEVLASKDATGGYAGLTLFKINFKNAANTITNFFNNSTTAARTYTFPDKDITVAGLVDITGTNSGTNTGDNAVNTLYSGLVSNATHTGDAEGATALTVKRINGVALSGLATGILKNTTTTGVPSIAVNSDLPAMSATVGGAVPTPPNNTTTFLRGDGTFAAPAAGSGDVTGPASSTTTALVRFNGTTGKIIQNSTVTVGDSGGIATTIANAGNAVGVAVTQNDVTNNNRGASIVNAGTGASLFVDQNGNTSASSSVGGAVLIENTGNTGPGLVVYSNQATSAGNLANFRVDNATFSHDGVRIDYDGTADGLSIIATAAASNALSISNTGVDHTLNSAYTGVTVDKGAMNLTSTNSLGSVFQIAGNPAGLGVGKITHNAVGDAGSSILSLAANDVTYAGQGIFLDMETVGTQKILNLRADGVEKLVLNSNGTATFAGDVTVPDEVYGVGWNASLEVPTKNAVYDKVDAMDTAIALNTAKVTNATHTGDATGATALTVVKIQGKDFPALVAGDDQKYPKYVSASNAFVMTAIAAGGGPTKISGNTGAFAADTTWMALSANSADVTVVTQTVAMTLTGLGVGTYRVKGALIYQTAAITTGIGVTLNHTGTLTRFVSNMTQVTTGGAAATGVGDQASAVVAGQLVEGKAERVKGTLSSAWAGVDTINADQLLIVDAMLIVSVSGNLTLNISSEVAASAVRLMAGSSLEVNKLA